MEWGKLSIKLKLTRIQTSPKAAANTMVLLLLLLLLLNKGHWENGKKHGEGIFTYLNKDVYSGWWKYGVKEGKGTYVYSKS